MRACLQHKLVGDVNVGKKENNSEKKKLAVKEVKELSSEPLSRVGKLSPRR